MIVDYSVPIETGLTDRERAPIHSATVDPGVFSVRGPYLWYSQGLLGAINMSVRLGSRVLTFRSASPNVVLPHWIKPTIERLLPLLRLKENWDTYGARPIAQSSARTALNLLLSVADYETPTPSVVPTPSGGIQLEWHTAGGIDLEIEIPIDGDASFFFQRGNTKPVEGTLPRDTSTLIGLVSQLR